VSWFGAWWIAGFGEDCSGRPAKWAYLPCYAVAQPVSDRGSKHQVLHDLVRRERAPADPGFPFELQRAMHHPERCTIPSGNANSSRSASCKTQLGSSLDTGASLIEKNQRSGWAPIRT
jgi:hypothetical protein